MDPLVKIGTFGLHVIKNPAGTYSYVGSVPAELAGKVHASRAEAIDAVVLAGYTVNLI